MATYVELQDLKTNEALLDKVEVACWVAAEAIRTDGSPPANQAARLVWAARVFDNARAEANRMLPLLLAQNKDAAVGAITGATDAAIQTNVNNAVNLFADNP